MWLESTKSWHNWNFQPQALDVANLNNCSTLKETEVMAVSSRDVEMVACYWSCFKEFVCDKER